MVWISFMLIGILLAACDASTSEPKQGDKPNVLFIAIDDMNDWVGFLGVNPQAHTPNLDKLAADGMMFTHAYTAAPSCNPSRVAVLTSLHPTTTGIYENAQLFRKYLPQAMTLPEHFRQSGYYTLGSGKIAHGRNVDAPSWNEYEPADHQRFDDPQPERRNFNGLHTGLVDWGVLPVEDKDMSDTQTVEWIEKQLATRHFDKPFFMGVGLFRPHLPWYVPQKYFDRVPALVDIQLPETREDDLDDIPPIAFDLKEGATHDTLHNMIVAHQQWKPAVRSYLASMAFTDEMVGRVLQALAKSPYANNTIVVLWSDHGIHLGEKKHWRKWTLWEESLRVPFVIKVPPALVAELPQGTSSHVASNRVVSLMDIFPTLVQLCHLPAVPAVQGRSLLPLLQKPDAEWPYMALSSYRKGNLSVRSERWHYIHYADGSEELYDHEKDPHEFDNLARKPGYEDILRQHRARLPKTEVDEGSTQDDPGADR
jgi:arylsulfatase A-like enzyme